MGVYYLIHVFIPQRYKNLFYLDITFLCTLFLLIVLFRYHIIIISKLKLRII